MANNDLRRAKLDNSHGVENGPRTKGTGFGGACTLDLGGLGGVISAPGASVSSSMSRAESRAQMEERVRSSVGSAQYTPGILGVPRRVSGCMIITACQALCRGCLPASGQANRMQLQNAFVSMLS